MKFYEAWWYIHSHPKFKDRNEEVTLEVFVAAVNPATGHIDNDKSLNTKTEVWLELVTVDSKGIGLHYTEYDTGADTYEKAVMEVAELLKADTESIR